MDTVAYAVTNQPFWNTPPSPSHSGGSIAFVTTLCDPRNTACLRKGSACGLSAGVCCFLVFKWGSFRVKPSGVTRPSRSAAQAQSADHCPTGEDLWSAYASADIFVMPSESETLGFVVMEAMASEVPVVAVRAGGIPDIINKDKEIGFLYPSGDADEAAALVKGLVLFAPVCLLAPLACASHWQWLAF